MAWYIRPSYFDSVKRCLAANPEDFRHQDEGIEEFFGFFVNQRPPVSIDPAGIAVITVSGVLGNRLTRLEKLLGFTDYEDIQAELDEITERAAKALLLEIDSPGGESQGAVETARAIAALDIPKASYTAGLDASAAYFLSSSVDRKFVSPSAFSGSIGTMLPWIDESKFWDVMGFSWEPIIGQGETLKGAGMGPSLTDAQREHFQAEVNALSAEFRDHVSKYREIDFESLQGAAYFGRKAIELNLADRIGTYDDTYQYLFRIVS